MSTCRIVGILGAVLALTVGCSSSTAELVKALAADPHTAGVYVDVGTPWGVQRARVCRSAPGQKVTCTEAGMTVEPAPPPPAR